MDTDKLVSKHFHQGRQCHACFKFTVFRDNADIVQTRFRIENRAGIYGFHSFVCTENQLSFRTPALFQGALKYLKEFLTAHGLYLIMESFHIIALSDKIGVSGDKNNLHPVVLASELFC